MLSIKNWDKFQHYKYKNKMPWFKLYGSDLLNDISWNKLKPISKVTLIELWCIGSEDKGQLPDPETLAFRLRQDLTNILTQLEILIEQGFIVNDSDSIEGNYNNSSVSIEVDYTNSSTDKIKKDKIKKDKIKKDNIIIDEQLIESQFDIFWGAYPKKVGKDNAEKAWLKYKPPIDIVLQTLLWQMKSKEWFQDGGKFIPYPATWINGKRWLDEKSKEITF